MNLFDLFQYITCLMMMILSMLNIGWPTLPTRRIIAALLVFILWFKMFDWMRLFDSTSFYIKLILVTIYDIMPFMVIYVIFLLMFGCAMDCISLNRPEDEEIIESYIGWWFVDLLINQHLLGLGDFAMDNYSGQNGVLVYVFFTLATFLTAVTALNMLIAIMGNTYDEVNDGYEEHSRQMKLSLLSDYVAHIRPKNHEITDSFLLVVTTLKEKDVEVNHFEQNVEQIRGIVDTGVANLQTSFKDRSDYISELIAEQKKGAQA